MKVSQLPLENTPDGSEEVVIVRGPANARETRRMAASKLAEAATRPTPEELKAAILSALVNGENITFTNNPDGTVGVKLADSPDLKGTPKAPTAAPGTNTTQIATTAFVKAVQDALLTLINGKQGALVEGSNIDIVDLGNGTFRIDASAPATPLTDGNYGDVTVSANGTVITVTKVTNGTVTVVDEAYGAAWDGKLSVPTKNAVYDQIEAVKASITQRVANTAVGAANGVASLDSTGKVPAAQLPSYVDDVLEFPNSAAFPATGETGKIYIALDTSAQWRWSGSAYTAIVASPGTTDNVVEGSTNKYFTDARVRAAVMTGLVNTAGTPVATDSLLTVLGKLVRQAFGQLLPLSGGNMTGSIVMANQSAYRLTDMSGTQPGLVGQSDNNMVFYSTDANGNQRGIWSVFARNSTAAFNVAVNAVVNGEFDAAGGIMWLRGSKGLVQHDSNAMYIRSQAGGGPLWLGSNGSNRWAIQTDGSLDGAANMVKTQYVQAYGADGQLRIMPRDGGIQFPYIWSDKNGTYRFQSADIGLLMTLDATGIDMGGRNIVANHITCTGNDGFVAVGSRSAQSDALFYNTGNMLRLWWGADKTTFDSSGNIWTNGNFSAASDVRLKSNIRPLERGLALVKALRGTRYEKDDVEQIGVIAQEVREVVPEVVSEQPNGMLAVDYGRLTAVLIEAVKDLSAEVDALKLKLAA